VTCASIPGNRARISAEASTSVSATVASAEVRGRHRSATSCELANGTPRRPPYLSWTERTARTSSPPFAGPSIADLLDELLVQQPLDLFVTDEIGQDCAPSYRYRSDPSCFFVMTSGLT
jgi:hypothetical protein